MAKFDFKIARSVLVFEIFGLDFFLNFKLKNLT